MLHNYYVVVLFAGHGQQIFVYIIYPDIGVGRTLTVSI